MAKKQEKTMEQLIEDALVLYEKTPYNLPSNWRWVRLINLVNHQSGNSKLIKGKLYSEKKDGLYDAYSAAGQDVFCSDYEHTGDAIIVSAVGAHCGKAFLATGKWSAIANTHIIFPTEGIDVKFLFYRMNDEKWWVRSGSAQPFIVVKETLERPFALPPIEEQKRIVEVIEKQFAKLDEARDLIQQSLDSCADRKSAILHKAFTGELTEKWRKEQGVEYFPTKALLKDCCQISSGGTPSRKRPEYFEGNIPWIKTGEINWNEIYDSEEHISETAIQNSSAKLYDPEVVLVAMYGMGVTRGRAAILKVRAATSQAVCVLKPHQYLLNKYLYYYFMCFYWNIREQAVGGNQLNLSGTIIGQLEIPIPSFKEQQEIVRILDSILEKEDKSKEIIDMLDIIDEMKKSILARAFRGELGTSNPNDESALVLLRKILENKETVSDEKKYDKKVPDKDLSFSYKLNRRQIKICEMLIQDGGLPLEKIAQGVGKDVRFLFDDLRELIDKRMIKLVDSRYWINADSTIKNQ